MPTKLSAKCLGVCATHLTIKFVDGRFQSLVRGVRGKFLYLLLAKQVCVEQEQDPSFRRYGWSMDNDQQAALFRHGIRYSKSWFVPFHQL